MSASPWKRLGLARTDDMTAIRRAYAKQLKTIDADADPKAFMALREALELAMASARRGAIAEPVPEPDAEPQPEPRAKAFEPATDSGPTVTFTFAKAQPRDDPDAIYRHFNALLFGPEPPDPEELAATLQAILDDPRMEQVTQATQVEQWLAVELVESVPRSDPVLGLAVAHFGWESDNGRWDQPALLAALTGRYKALLFLNHISQQSHPLYAAYVELTQPGGDLGLNRFFIGRHVHRLLEIIRTRCPEAEAWLYSARVAAWDARRRPSGSGVGWWFFAVFLLLYVLNKLAG